MDGMNGINNPVNVSKPTNPGTRQVQPTPQ